MSINIDKVIKTARQADYFSGIVSTSKKGEEAVSASYGYAKREDKIPNNKNTAFGIASGTKGFTALGILKLIDDGKLSLTDRVFDILPQPFPNMKKEVEVRHLLSNTSGIFTVTTDSGS